MESWSLSVFSTPNCTGTASVLRASDFSGGRLNACTKSLAKFNGRTAKDVLSHGSVRVAGDAAIEIYRTCDGSATKNADLNNQRPFGRLLPVYGCVRVWDWPAPCALEVVPPRADAGGVRPPHVYAVAEEAYRGATSSAPTAQVVVVSG